MAVKEEREETLDRSIPSSNPSRTPSSPVDVIALSSDDEEPLPAKRKKQDEDGDGVVLPLGFLDPLPERLREPKPYRQFWKAGDFDAGDVAGLSHHSSVDIEHVRVHPKFLHSNATSHKWALGAFAELMDNALDEVCHGATFVNIDVLDNEKDGTKMLLVEDNGGGMDPDNMRQCMSLGYSAKSRMKNTIGQYGNGFKTSTMRLGADVIVFTRCLGKDGKSPTQSIGMLSYTFLTNTGKEDIVVPMLDYEKVGSYWHKMMRMSSADWSTNLATILQWSPYTSESSLLNEFHSMGDQGTRIIVYNLWEDDEGELELDFNNNKQDIQLRGVNRDEKKIEMATKFPNSRHFLTYQHSLRSYASIIYLRLPSNFRMILRGQEIQHHNIVNDMMLAQEITYRPQHSDSNLAMKDVAVVTIGFVKDAKDHIDVQGFNVYHKNRLIKPFWRVWNATGSDGRGVIGLLEADFVEPAHDKQGFERTTVLARLENRLIHMQKHFWSRYCHKIGYAPRRNKKLINAQDRDRDSSPEEFRHSSPSPSPWSLTCRDGSSRGTMPSLKKWMDSPKNQSGDKSFLSDKTKQLGKSSRTSFGYSAKSDAPKGTNDHRSSSRKNRNKSIKKSKLSNCKGFSSSSDSEPESGDGEDISECEFIPRVSKFTTDENANLEQVVTKSTNESVGQLTDENQNLKDRMKRLEELMSTDLQYEKERGRSLAEKLETAEKRLEMMNKEHEALIDMFSEERCRRDKEEEALRKTLKDASSTIQELLQKAGVK